MKDEPLNPPNPIHPDGLAMTAEAPAAPSSVGEALAEQVLIDKFLDGGEMISLAIKPSRWRVVFELLPWVVGVAAAVAVLVAMGPSVGLSSGMVARLAMAILIVRAGIAVASWMGTLYMLTNCRVMTITGIFRQRIRTVSLSDIDDVLARQRPHERTVNAGDVEILADDSPTRWECVAEPQLVREKILRFKRRFR